MNITESIAAIARERPEFPALEAGAAALNYGEFDRAVSWLADSFLRAGIAPGDFVGIRLDNATQFVLTSTALARLGAGQTSFDPRDSLEFQQSFAKRLGVSAIVAEPDPGADRGAPLVAPPPRSLADLKDLPEVADPTAAESGLPWLALRSSGTTVGTHKVSVLTHRLAYPRLEQMCHGLPYAPGTRYLSLIDLSFSSATQRMFCCFTRGASLIVHNLPDIDHVLEFVARRGVTFMAGSPTHAARLVQFADERRNIFPGLDAFRVGANMVRGPLRENVRRHLTPNLFVGYGVTEIGTVSIATPDQIAAIPGVVGHVVPHVQAEIVDEEGRAVPPGTVGIVRLKAAGGVSAYYDDPEATAAAFRDGWFYPNDLAEFTPDGALIHHGRADDLIILDGINIFPVEIEDVLLRFPGVEEAAVFPRPAGPRGSVPIAAVVAGREFSKEALARHCRYWLGSREPYRVFVVDSMPKTAAGKIKKGELADMVRRQWERQEEKK